MHLMPLLHALIATSLLLSVSPIPQEPTPPKPGMKQFQLVMLRTGKSQPGAAENVVEKQKKHLENLERMWMSDGKAVLIGPFVEKSDIRGIALLKTSLAEAKMLFADDPYIKDGDMVADIRTLWLLDGVFQKPPKFLDLTPYTFGFLRRPTPAPPPIAEEVGAKLIAGHLANLDHLREVGELVIAGPFTDSPDLLGIVVFRSADKAKVTKLMAEDPAIKAGRFRLELFTAATARGAFPPPPGEKAK